VSSPARFTGHGGSAQSSALQRLDVGRRALVAWELVTGVTGVVGGVLLTAAADGSLLRTDPATLAGSPSSDWRAPGAAAQLRFTCDVCDPAVITWRNEMSVGNGSWFLIEEYRMVPRQRGAA